MERIAFLIEETGERISCLLNPESLVQRRSAGLRSLAAATGIITGAGLSDDPVIATGGGVTEYDLDLLFDVDLAREEQAPFAGEAVPAARLDTGSAEGEADGPLLVPAPRPASDVRELTRPFWALAENGPSEDAYGAPPVVRMIWGRAWNVLGVVVAVAERLERFSSTGMPARSWMRMRLRRVSEPSPGKGAPGPVTPQFELPAPDLIGGVEGLAIAVNVATDGQPVTRLDQIAAEHYGDADAWRLIAAANDIDDPLNLIEGLVLRLPGLGGPRAP
ncbi:MAG: hypothetical protein IT535_13800 [Bauldia sp.]|nr:hypothetical protein [Bauldia sp.]